MSPFPLFAKKLSEALAAPLPGESAQYLMAPFERKLRALKAMQQITPKPGAVLVLFYPKAGHIHTVLILRNTYPGVHSGQVAFPGGKKDMGDASLEATALRETYEEIGMPPGEVTVVGKLTPLFIPPSAFLVSPFIGITHKTPVFQPDPAEVSQVLEVTLDTLLDESIVKEKQIQLAAINRHVNAPYFDIAGQVVWGATAMMISELKMILRKFM